MKRKYTSLIIGSLSGLLLLGYLAKEPIKAAVSSPNDATEALMDIMKKQYGESVHCALFSLPEFRSFSIIAFDKTIANYDNQYRSPEYYVKILSHSEKSRLLSNAVKSIDQDGNYNSRLALCNKIKRWCKTENQFEFIETKFDIARDSLMKCFAELAGTSDIMAQFKSGQNSTAGNIPAESADQAYFAVINYLAEKTDKQQMLYFSDLYKSLSNTLK